MQFLPFPSNRIDQGTITTLLLSELAIENCSFCITFMLSLQNTSLFTTW